jgi:hypothetical protein
MESKDFVDLWKHENTIANQKTSFYFASVAFLIWPTIQSIDVDHIKISVTLSLLGLLFSLLSFFSISRTIAFRDHWKRQLKIADESNYSQVFGSVHFEWHQKLPSNAVLIGLPLLGGAFWVIIATGLLIRRY